MHNLQAFCTLLLDSVAAGNLISMKKCKMSRAARVWTGCGELRTALGMAEWRLVLSVSGPFGGLSDTSLSSPISFKLNSSPLIGSS